MSSGHPIHLPPEILRLILRRATDTPGLLDTSWDYDPKDLIWEDWPEWVDEGLVTKRTIVQVCWEWRDVGIEFLYETIFFRSTKEADSHRLRSLIRTFTISATTASGGCFGYGWWTKRITCQYALFSDDYAEEIFALLEQCHNIQIFTFSAEESTSSEPQARLVRLLETRFPHSLRRAELFAPVGIQVPNLIPRVARLTSFGGVVGDNSPNNIDATLLKHITTLSINLLTVLYTFPSQWDLPLLTTLALLNVSPQDVGALIPFVKQHQNTLLHLFVSTWGRSSQLPVLIASTPHLRSLSLDETALGTLVDRHAGGSNSNTILLPKLTYLGIICDPHRRNTGLLTQDSLTKVLERGLFPDLKTIRLLSDTRSMSTQVTSLEMTERCGRYGVRLENRRGELNWVE